MEKRNFGQTGRQVSVIGLGTWQYGGDWGEVGDQTALGILETAVAGGVTLLDTADVYGNGHSEQLIGRFLDQIGGADDNGLTVITKMGRRADPHVPEAYTLANFRAWLDRSRTNLGMDRLHLVQLHCPPTPVYAMAQVYDDLDTLVEEGVIAAYGVSVETVAEALEAMEHEHVATIQIICNILRRKPLEVVLPLAQAKGVGIIARVPLASGLLSGTFTKDTRFAPQDHRTFNRHGEAFDMGETFSGVPYDQGLKAGAEVARIAEGLGCTAAQLALRWLLDQPGITTVIPGASKVAQAQANGAAAELAPLSGGVLAELKGVYERYAEPYVADRW